MQNMRALLRFVTASAVSTIIHLTLITPLISIGVGQHKEKLMKTQQDNLKREYAKIIRDMESQNSEHQRAIKRIRFLGEIRRRAFIEKAAGLKSVFEAMESIQEYLDNGIISGMLHKPRPALKSAEQVKEQSKLRREAQKEAKINKSIIEYYENMYPELVEIRENELESSEQEQAIDVTYTEREKEDPISQFISKIEYNRLNNSERNQLALDRYWKRRHSSVHLGKMYERYVGYLFEKDGYNVEYVGISKKLKDMGRDLICTKGKTIVIVQCKYWSKHKNVYENRVFQHFGTVYEYKKQHKEKRVIGALYSTTEVAEDAKNIAKILKIKVVENHTFNKDYPCIKCNISRDGTKIYHLPFDQQYDNIKIEPDKGEFYATTVKEAEKAGFRRAYRFKGLK